MQVHEYFPGGNTPNGFFSYYKYILPSKEAQKRIILKGGPGCGKSTLMKKTADILTQNGYTVDLLHCSSDPSSLDAIVVSELGFSMVDGTAPHVTDPLLPGATDEIINLGMFWNTAKLAQNKKEITALTQNISDEFSDAYDFLSAAARLQNFQTKCALRQTDKRAVTLKLNALLSELNLSAHIHEPGKIKKAFISAFTPDGLIHYTDAFTKGKTRTVRVLSEYNLSSLFMNPLAQTLLQSGADIFLFYCPMQPDTKIEHIYLPSENLFITTENTYHKTENIYADIDLNIHMAPFAESEKTQQQTDALFSDAIRHIQIAKSLHDELEQYYIPYMNFDALEQLPEKIIETLI